jgi:hypothetical protein
VTEFELDSNKRYKDDPNKEIYEIRKIGDESYFVLIAAAVKIALAMDESKMFGSVKVGFELREDSFNSFSSIDNFIVSLVCTLVIMAVFLGVLYFSVSGAKDSVFGFL